MVTEHQVRERAYFIWEIEGRQIDQAEAHWLRAEIELTEALAPLSAAGVAARATHTASAAKVLKPKLKSPKAATKPTEPKELKAKRPTRSKAEHAAALH